MVDKKAAARYLAQGVPTSQVAMAVGCDESYISQLRHDPEVVEWLKEFATDVTIQDTAFDNRVDDAEEKALQRLEKTLPFANFAQSLAAFRTLNAARRRKEGPAAPAATTINVNLTLPASALPRYVSNSQNEIVEVEGRTMVSATPASLEAVMAVRMNKQLQPGITDANKAESRLGSLMPLPPREPRRLPVNLSVDML